MSEKEAITLVEKLIESRSIKEVEELKIQICQYLSANNKIIKGFADFIDFLELRKQHMKDGVWFKENDIDIYSVTSLIQHVSQENGQ